MGAAEVQRRRGDRRGRASSDYVSVADVGRCINPQQCEGQDEGAVMQGLGHTLLEEMVYDGGQLLNANLVDYRVPRADDVPRAPRAASSSRTPTAPARSAPRARARAASSP